MTRRINEWYESQDSELGKVFSLIEALEELVEAQRHRGGESKSGMRLSEDLGGWLIQDLRGC